MHAADRTQWHALKQRVVQTLMIPLAMIMRRKLRHRSPEIAFADITFPLSSMSTCTFTAPEILICLAIGG